MRLIAVAFLLASVAYGLWSFDNRLMLCRRRVVVVMCGPPAAARM